MRKGSIIFCKPFPRWENVVINGKEKKKVHLNYQHLIGIRLSIKNIYLNRKQNSKITIRQQYKYSREFQNNSPLSVFVETRICRHGRGNWGNFQYPTTFYSENEETVSGH
jgi:hypothetical protein